MWLKFVDLFNEHFDKLTLLALLIAFRMDDMLVKELLAAYFILVRVTNKGDSNGQTKQ